MRWVCAGGILGCPRGKHLSFRWLALFFSFSLSSGQSGTAVEEADGAHLHHQRASGIFDEIPRVDGEGGQGEEGVPVAQRGGKADGRRPPQGRK